MGEGAKPPPPPRAKKPRPVDEASYATYPRVGVTDLRTEFTGRRRQDPPNEDPDFPLASKGVLDLEPETTIGQTVSIQGKLSFETLLRLDGKFEGELLSTGDLVVGPTGELVGDIKDMKEVVVFGKIIGSIFVERLELCGSASIYGNITCKVLHMDPTVVLVGRLNINPYAPQHITPDGKPVLPDVQDDDPPDDAADVEEAVEAAMMATPTSPNEVGDDSPADVAADEPAAAGAADPPVAYADGVGEIPVTPPEQDTASKNAAAPEPESSTQVATDDPPSSDSPPAEAAAGATGEDPPQSTENEEGDKSPPADAGGDDAAPAAPDAGGDDATPTAPDADAAS